MIKPLEDFLKSLAYWLDSHGDITCEVKETEKSDIADVGLTDDEGEEFYIGTCAESGMLVRWIGAVQIPGRDKLVELVEINGVVFEVMPRDIAGWAIGRQ